MTDWYFSDLPKSLVPSMLSCSWLRPLLVMAENCQLSTSARCPHVQEGGLTKNDRFWEKKNETEINFEESYLTDILETSTGSYIYSCKYNFNLLSLTCRKYWNRHILILFFATSAVITQKIVSLFLVFISISAVSLSFKWNVNFHSASCFSKPGIELNFWKLFSALNGARPW